MPAPTIDDDLDLGSDPASRPGRRAARPGLRRKLAWMGLVVALVAAMGCTADDDDSADGTPGDDSDDDFGEQAASAEARAVAEALRVVILADESDGLERREVESLQENVDDIPGEPDISGIADEDGDGLDDDGNIEVTVDAEVSCLNVAEDGDVDVTGGAC